MAIWTVNGQVVKDENGNSITRSLTSSGEDSASITLAVDADTNISAIGSVESAVEIRRDGELFFKGVITKITPQATGSSEGITIDCESYWYWLERIVYQQSFKYWNTGTEAEETLSVSKVVLGQKGSGGSAGSLIDAKEALEDIIAYAGTFDGNIAVGTIPASMAVDFPPIEVSSMTCAECIRTILRWIPDAVISWNHNTNGRINITRKVDATTCDITHSEGTVNGRGVTSVSVDPLQRNKVRGVVINYETIETVDGVGKVSLVQDTAGATSGKNVIVHNISLRGGEATTQRQYVKTDSIPEQSGVSVNPTWGDVTTAWLAKKFPQIGSSTLLDSIKTKTTVTDIRHIIDLDNVSGPGTPPDGSELYPDGTYPYELLEGAINDNMAGVTAAKTTVKITLKWTASEAMWPYRNVPLIKIMEQNNGVVELYYDCTGTNSPTKTYTSTAATAGEAVPVGIAQQIYDGMKDVMSSGSITVVEVEPTTNAQPGQRIQLAAPFATFGTGSMVQSVTTNVFSGTTTVRFGPYNSMLGPADLIELMRVGQRSPDGGGYGSGSSAGGGISASAARTSSDAENHASTVTDGPLATKNTSANVAVPSQDIMWSHVTYRSATSVDISEGCVMVTELGSPTGDDPLPTKTLTRLYASSAFRPAQALNQTVSNGSKIYVKLTWTEREYTSGVTGVNEIIGRVLECTNAEYHITSGSVTDDSQYSYILIAEIAISGSDMTITRHNPGVITAPSLTLPYTLEEGGSSPAIDYKWFHVSKTGATSVSVEEGRVLAPDFTSLTGTATSPDYVLKEYTVSTASVSSIVNGDKIYLKITFSDTGAYTSTLDTSITFVASDPDLSGGLNVGIEGKLYTYSSATIERHNTPPSNTATVCYVLLAEITVSGGEITLIKQRHDGVVTAPSLVIPIMDTLTWAED